jgi:preprotein translocase subunit SecA
MFSLKKLFGDSTTRALKAYEPLVARINALEPEFEALSDEALRAKTALFKGRLAAGETLDALLPEAFAAVRESSKRTLGQRHFDVQLLGGILLHKGGIAEMRTGEGKTLVATLPAYLNALSGAGVHVVTVNDYLSRRDAAWMGQIYDALGLSVGVINHESSFLYDPLHKELDPERDLAGSYKVVHEFLRPVSRQDAYRADITYGTNNEFGFDYLRDNIEYESGNLRQREWNYAIVDEIDSILIDEARTPLIISAPTVDSEDLYVTFAKIADRLVADVDYKVEEKHKSVTLTDAGIEKAEKALNVDNIYTDKGIKYVHHLETATRAKALFRKDKEYVVRDGEVIIVDEFTGRMQPGRRWSEGLHQAIEAKEGVAIAKESRTYASITFQNYFRLYRKLSGMTGTAATSSEEFLKVYNLTVAAIPTNKPIARIDHNDLIFQTETGKLKAITAKVKELNAKGQPVLIGTASIEKNEVVSAYLLREGIAHQVLNAKNHEREGEIIADAGKFGAVTIATNIAGRGVDIKLGGVPFDQERASKVRALGGLFVLGTERHEARRIDNQLRGRSGRQGDPGETQFFVSLEDNLMRVFAADTVKKMMGRFGIPEDMPIENFVVSRSLESAQSKIEGFNFDARKHVLEYDDVMNHQRKIVYERRRKLLLGDRVALEARLAEIAADDAFRAVIDEKKRALGEAEFWNAVRRIFLQTMDVFWIEHLEMMDYLRGSVNLRAYGQRDPLVEYKKDGLRLFKEMQANVDDEVARLIPHIAVGAFLKEEEQMKKEAKLAQAAGGDETSGQAPVSTGPKNESGERIGRNDPCYCGSGKKYKKCHGQ